MEYKNLLESIINAIKNIINIDGFRNAVSNYINKQYLSGLDNAEVQFDMNFVPENREVDFLTDYAFNNLEQHTDAIGNELRQVISRSILDKRDVSSIKKIVKETFNDKKYVNRLKTVLRTEGMRAANMGSLEGAKQSGIPLRKYIDIVDDNRTSDVSRAMFAKYGSVDKSIPLDKEFSVRVHGKTYSGQAPPFMPNDRDTLRYSRE